MRSPFAALLAWLLLAMPALAQSPQRNALAVEAGTGRILNLPGPAANVFVADPKVAEVRPASPTSLFVFGTGPGRTTIAALSAEGRTVGLYELTVRPSTYAAREATNALRRVPGQSLQFEQNGGSLTAAGTVGTPEQAFLAERAARAQFPANQRLLNTSRTQTSIQVQLQVRIAEVSRNVTREFGINWTALGNIGRIALSGATGNVLPVLSGLTTARGTFTNTNTSVDVILQALAADQLARVLAEPNLTAISGEVASFLVGGEYPIPVAQANVTNGYASIIVEYKPFGVGLSFVPTVLDGNRINLRLRSEVSALTQNGAISSTVNGITLPGLTVRRAETSVELGSGQSLAIAGLLQDNITQTNNTIPWLGEIPILGTLFRSDAFQRQKTELVIIVTPIIVNPVSNPNTLAAPGDDMPVPTDAERILLLRQVGAGEQPVPAVPVRLPGSAGFIVQ